ncbi:hypothetical protein BJX66DRAFT_310375 [Aspergillus keveii]|uniref:Uncharacterized protein n=1 Tax=Aspergillus keveii TaxID=714993 RepID=A0ABR4FWP1_9EURO
MARSKKKAATHNARQTTWLEWLGLSAPPAPPGRRIIVCGPNVYRPTQRTVLDTENIRVYGWPSRGGVIILSGASRVDFDYLGWDILDLPRKRDPDHDAEDEHCKKLLLLGATWYDSEARYTLLAAAAVNHRPTRERFENKEVPAVTMKEGLCVRVGWPSTGGLWVVECVNPRFEEVLDEYAEEYGPTYVEKFGLVGLARDMDERCEIIERIGGKFFACLEDYDGYASLRAWEEKTTGEVGRLVQTRYVDW